MSRRKANSGAAEYACRDCGFIFAAGFNERIFGRVRCPKCLGTSDPTRAAIESLAKQRARQDEVNRTHGSLGDPHE